MSIESARRYIHPSAVDTWQSIAARELADMAEGDATGALQSWNFHVFMRPAAPAGSPREGNPLLPSDVIFIEAPKPQDSAAS